MRVRLVSFSGHVHHQATGLTAYTRHPTLLPCCSVPAQLPLCPPRLQGSGTGPRDSLQPPECGPILVRAVPGLAVLGFADAPAMVVGRDLIGSTRTVFSLATHTIYVQPPQAQ